jgi:GH24 family phage-related lysozyme (muramidase)
MAFVSHAALVGWLYGGSPVDPQARAEFPDLLLEFGEGATTYGYPDNMGNITIGRGNEIPNLDAWEALDWGDANPDEIVYAWAALQAAAEEVKANGPNEWPGGGAFAGKTKIRATQESIDLLIQKRLDEFDSALRQEWPGWDEAPPPAQSVLMRLAWACGTVGKKGVNHIGWPKLYAFWVAKNWAGCSTQCAIPALEKTEPGANERARELFLSCVDPTTTA